MWSQPLLCDRNNIKIFCSRNVSFLLSICVAIKRMSLIDLVDSFFTCHVYMWLPFSLLFAACVRAKQSGLLDFYRGGNYYWLGVLLFSIFNVIAMCYFVKSLSLSNALLSVKLYNYNDMCSFHIYIIYIHTHTLEL